MRLGHQRSGHYLPTYRFPFHGFLEFRCQSQLY